MIALQCLCLNSEAVVDQVTNDDLTTQACQCSKNKDKPFWHLYVLQLQLPLETVMKHSCWIKIFANVKPRSVHCIFSATAA